MDCARVVVECTNIDRIFPCQPRVACRLEYSQNLTILLTRTHFRKVAHLTFFGHFDVLCIAFAEFSTIQLRKILNRCWIEQGPVLIFFDALHEFVAQEHSGVCKARTKIWVARVLLEVEELWG